MLKPFTLTPRHLVATLIRGYQLSLSPDHGFGRALAPAAGCRFYPSCSEYTRQAVLRWGAARGVMLGLRRLLRCHPWAQGGVDPIPT